MNISFCNCANAIPSRPRLFEAKQAIQKYEWEHRPLTAFWMVGPGKYGANALFTGKNMLEGATQLERNGQIGGHRK